MKTAEIDDFGLPKTCRHHPEMPCRSTFHITCSFAAMFPFFGAFVAVCCLTAKCLKPSKNCGFVTLRPSKHYARVRPQNPENVCQKPTVPKTLPKRQPSPSKTEAEIVLCFNTAFVGCRTRFWRVFGLQHEANFAVAAAENWHDCTCGPSRAKHLVQIASWKPSGLILEAPGIALGNFWNEFGEVWSL